LKKGRRNSLVLWRWRLNSAAKRGAPCFETALVLVFVFLRALPLTESPSIVTLRSRRAQELVGQLSAALSLHNPVQIAVVIQHPLVFSVEPLDANKKTFRLSMELGFLRMLDDDELRAAIAHELGHVWIFTHHPYLQTERVANSIGERVVKRVYFEKLYLKLRTYERRPGVPIEQLLGPDPDANRRSAQNPE
jgi:hypothetical protein